MSLSIWNRRFLTLAVTASIIVPLAACGSNTASGTTKLTYLSWDNEQMSKPYINEFEKENPTIKVDFSYSPPTSEYLSTLQTRLVGNQAPDVFIITSENRDDLIKNGYVRDLSNEPFMKNISKANKDFVSRENKVYGMSTISWASGIAYNKDLLKKVGYDEPPANWDDFLKLCKKLKASGVEPLLEPNADEPSRFIDAFQGSILAKKDVDPMSFATKKIQTPGSDELEAVKAYIRLYNEGGVSRDTVGLSGDDMKTQFTNGQVAMIVDGAWDFATFKQANMNWGFAMMPRLGDGYEQYAQGSASPGWAIYSKLSGDKLKAAEKFLTFMSGKWALQKHNDVGDAVTVSNFKGTVMKEYQTVYDDSIKPGKYYLHTNFYSKPDVLKSELKAQNQQLVQGQINPTQYAKNIDKKLGAAQ